MNNFKGIQSAQRELVAILSTNEYRLGTLSPLCQSRLDNLIAFCEAYYNHREVQSMNEADFTHYHNQHDWAV